MRILLVHNVYQEQGGEGVVFQNEGDLLRGAGHEVHEWIEDNRRIDSMSRIAVCTQTIWSEPSRKHLWTILDELRPEVIHFHNTFPLISPSAYYACSEVGIPVVQTLHNYRLLCPSADLYRNGAVCEDCSTKVLKWPSIVHGCYRDSRIATLVTATMLAAHRSLGTWTHKIDRYIAVSEFARQKYIQGGLPAKRIAVKPNFVPRDPGMRRGSGDTALFVGRLGGAKGLETLLRAWAQCNASFPLRVVGDGPMQEIFRGQVETLGLDSVYWDGAVPAERVPEIMKVARFLVVPSGSYETFSLVIAEAYACGVPVIASRIGALAEIVHDGVTGLLFTPGDAVDLAQKIRWARTHPAALEEMGHAARVEYESKYTATQSLETLVAIYEQSIAGSAASHKSEGTTRSVQIRRAQTLDTESLPTFRVLGVQVHSIQVPAVIARMKQWIRSSPRGHWIAPTGMHGITEAQHDRSFRNTLNAADLVVPDGMTLVWCGRIRGYALARRVYGPELMETFCRETLTEGFGHFLYGGAPGVAERLAESLRRSCPGIRIAGMFSPPFRALTQDEDAAIVALIRESGASVVWVGLGTPRQEQWMSERCGQLQGAVLVGVRAAFDILSGGKRQAPAWMRENGLEWLFRLLQEPKRLWRRYLVYGVRFIFLAVLEMAGLRQFE